MIKKYLLLITLLLGLSNAHAEAPRISLLTCGPTDEYVFYLYGHTALRVQYGDTDLVYNYGYFSLEQKNFLINFMIGKPMYSLGVTTFQDFLWEYSAQGREVVEQELALTDEEATLLSDKLNWNALPENRDYQYNFYFDNCATRPRDMIEEVVGGLRYDLPLDQLPTFREAIRGKSHTAVWYTLGADICLGWKSDRQMSIRDAGFLPELLAQEMDTARRVDTGELLVTKKTTWVPQTRVINNPVEKCHFPLIVFLLIGLYLYLLKWGKWDKARVVSEKVLYALLTIGGVTVWFLALFSEHPHTWPNANMLFLHPFWLWLVFTHGRKKCHSSNKWLYFCNFVAIALYLLSSTFQRLPIDLPVLALVVVWNQIDRWRACRNKARTDE